MPIRPDTMWHEALRRRRCATMLPRGYTRNAWRRGVSHTPAMMRSVGLREHIAGRRDAWRRGVSHTPAMMRSVGRREGNASSPCGAQQGMVACGHMESTAAVDTFLRRRARGEWKPGGSALPGADAYATSKQCTLATVIEFARETPRLRFNALEPGFTPNTGLGREANVFLRFLTNYTLPLLAPFMKYWSSPKQAARVATKVVSDSSGQTGIYYDDGGHPMHGSTLMRDPKFTSRVVAETRALLSTIPT
jgi:hypothetical protein